MPTLPLITPAELILIAPEFSLVSVFTIQYYLDMAETEVSEDRFGSITKTARLLLACHYMIVFGVINQAAAMANNSAAGASSGAGANALGSIKRLKVGQTEIEYGLGNSGQARTNYLASGFDSNRYGREYARLIEAIGISMRVL